MEFLVSNYAFAGIYVEGLDEQGDNTWLWMYK